MSDNFCCIKACCLSFFIGGWLAFLLEKEPKKWGENPNSSNVLIVFVYVVRFEVTIKRSKFSLTVLWLKTHDFHVLTAAADVFLQSQRGSVGSTTAIFCLFSETEFWCFFVELSFEFYFNLNFSTLLLIDAVSWLLSAASIKVDCTYDYWLINLAKFWSILLNLVKSLSRQ